MVHAFRTVVSDSGANTGLIVSSAGFQQGATDAATHSNEQLLDWTEFQHLFVRRWYRAHMRPRIANETFGLADYTQLHAGDKLAGERRERFNDLRLRYAPLEALNFLSFHPDMDGAHPSFTTHDSNRQRAVDMPPELPISETLAGWSSLHLIPDEARDATALRPLMEVMLDHSLRAIAEFHELFERE